MVTRLAYCFESFFQTCAIAIRQFWTHCQPVQRLFDFVLVMNRFPIIYATIERVIYAHLFFFVTESLLWYIFVVMHYV